MLQLLSHHPSGGGFPMLESKYFRTCFGIMALLLILYLGSKVSFLFRPFVSMVKMLIFPTAIAGFFYYLLRPIVDYLERQKIKRALAVLMIYFVFGESVPSSSRSYGRRSGSRSIFSSSMRLFSCRMYSIKSRSCSKTLPGPGLSRPNRSWPPRSPIPSTV